MKKNKLITFFLLTLFFCQVSSAKDKVTQDEMYDVFKTTNQKIESELKNNQLLKQIHKTSDQIDLDAARTFLDSVHPDKNIQREASNLVSQDLSEKAKSFLNNIDKETEFIPGRDKLPDQRTIYFVSFSMPESLLKTVLSLAAEHPGAEVLFRGLKDQSNFITHQKAIIELVDGMQNKPKIGLDPLAFRRFNISLVPTIIIQNIASVYKARGVISIPKMEHLITDNPKPDKAYLGKFSETYEIAEMDLIELMKIRFAKIDWKKKGDEVKKNFWNGDKRFVLLPKAKKDSERVIPTLVKINEDIVTPHGTVLARKGQQFDLAKDRPLSKWYLIVDATDKKQIEFVKTIKEQAKQEGRPVKVIFNRFHGDLGWKEFNRLGREIKQVVYILQPDMKKRFNIYATPSLIRHKNNKLVIQEYYLGDENEKS